MGKTAKKNKRSTPFPLPVDKFSFMFFVPSVSMCDVTNAPDNRELENSTEASGNY